MINKPITVFEHSSIEVGKTEGLTKKHLEDLRTFQEEIGKTYADIYSTSVAKFKQWVGILQVGDICFEVLPKIDKVASQNLESEQVKWRSVLIQMLQATKKLPIHITPNSDLLHEPDLLLQVYLNLFLEEVEKLQHKGLIKKYRTTESNSFALKGQLLFSKHLTKNVVHQERFYVRHTTYDKQHLLHQVLYQALLVIPKLLNNNDLIGKWKRILLDFPEMPNTKITAKTFKSIRLTRKTQGYKQALLIAKMILLNYYPNLQTEGEDVFALLFDMNRLWEEYVLESLQMVQQHDVFAKSQKQQIFWEAKEIAFKKSIKADIIIYKNNKPIVVLDTKWKLLEDAKNVNDADLKQMYVYCHYYQTNKSFLVYPHTESKELEGIFKDDDNNSANLVWTNIFTSDNELKSLEKFGQDLFKQLAISVPTPP